VDASAPAKLGRQQPYRSRIVARQLSSAFPARAIPETNGRADARSTRSMMLNFDPSPRQRPLVSVSQITIGKVRGGSGAVDHLCYALAMVKRVTMAHNDGSFFLFCRSASRLVLFVSASP